MSHTDPGFKAEDLLTARITPNESFCEDAARCLPFYHSAVNRAQASPGFAGAALVNTLPLEARITKRNVDLEDHIAVPGENAPLLWLDTVTPNYLHVMGITALAGRNFNDADEAGGPVVVRDRYSRGAGCQEAGCVVLGDARRRENSRLRVSR
jgi:hypothetical protein